MWKCSFVSFVLLIKFSELARFNRIASGKDSKPNENLDYALLNVIFQNQAQQCGGSLIAPQHVLTSATCVVDPVEGKASVINVTFPQAKNSMTSKRRIYVHPDYNYLTHADDIAILQLEKSMNVDGTTLSLATLESLAKNETLDSHVSMNLRVCGYGSISNYPKYSKTLQCTDVNEVDPSNCSPKSTTTPICTQWLDRDNNVCNGDYGGPIYSYSYVGNSISQKVIGISTYSPDYREGASCLDAHKVSYISVASYSSWISSIINVS